MNTDPVQSLPLLSVKHFQNFPILFYFQKSNKLLNVITITINTVRHLKLLPRHCKEWKTFSLPGSCFDLDNTNFGSGEGSSMYGFYFWRVFGQVE